MSTSLKFINLAGKRFYKRPRNIISVLDSCVGSKLSLKGWASNIRKQKKTSFINLVDGSTNKSLQIVVNSSDIDALTIGSFVEVKGTLEKSLKTISSNLQINGLELKADSIIFDKKSQCCVSDSFSSSVVDFDRYRSEEGILHRHQLSNFKSLFRFRSEIKLIIDRVFKSLCYLEVETPILTSLDCEESDNTFNIQGIKNLKLTGSSQMHLEILCQGLGQVFTQNQTFRAEPSHTRFHLAEFRMIEAESIHLLTVEDLNNEIELIFKKIISSFLSFCQENPEEMQDILRISNLKKFEEWIEELNEFSIKSYPRIKYCELDKYLGDKWDLSNGLSKEAELLLVEKINSPLFLTHFPIHLKPAYCKIEGGETLSSDLLFPQIGEVVGGSVRVGPELEIASFPDWYSRIRRMNTYGGSGGFGIGFERILQLLFKLSNIRDSSPFPRVMNKFLF